MPDGGFSVSESPAKALSHGALASRLRQGYRRAFACARRSRKIRSCSSDGGTASRTYGACDSRAAACAAQKMRSPASQTNSGVLRRTGDSAGVMMVRRKKRGASSASRLGWKFRVPFRPIADWIPEQSHPRKVPPPWHGRARGEAARDAAEKCEPPLRLPHGPREAAAACVSELARRAEHRDCGKLQQRATHQHAPQLVPGMTLMRAHLVPLSRGEVMADGRRRFVAHLPAGCDAAQREVRLLVGVEKKSG